MLQNASFYNEDRKQSFIDETYQKYEASAVKAITAFNKIAPVELSVSKDFADFDPDEVQDVMKKCISTLSTSTVIVTLSILKRYIRWCAAHDIISDYAASTHGIMTRTSASMTNENPEVVKSKIINTMLRSKDDFINFLDTFMRAEKNEMVRACCCLLWLGFGISEIFQIKISDIDMNGMSIKGIKFGKEDEDLLHIIHGVAMSTSFTEFHKHRQSEELAEFTYKYMPTEYIIRSARTRTSDYQTDKAPFITRKIAEIEREIRPTLPDGHRFKNFTGTFSSIARSSAYCKVYAYKQDNGDEAVKSNITNLLDVSNTRMNIHCKYKDYKAWEQYCMEQ